MTDAVEVIVGIAWLSGLGAFVGGLFAWHEGSADTETKREIIHGVIAFGGGTLVAAVAFALMPVGMAVLPPWGLALAFCLGGGLFCALDAWLERRGGSFAQFMAMLMDFLPEAVSLGAVFSHDRRLGILLAGFIGIQNLPEGFNAFREMRQSGLARRRILVVLFGVSLLGPVAAWLGHAFLQTRPALTASLMAFAAGGILYLIFQDIAPQSRMRNHWTPPLGAVLGFLVGMLGNVLIL
ncbi:ZIP family metal transporter [Modicisalibacter coralii]|uniref:ZIP family metal transporter n=1 Tax=Modicisalibacter coralii TaxID=2304602 RepID=UPI00100A55E5|nr:ZIP family metal transporter [Halomonas coralii]